MHPSQVIFGDLLNIVAVDYRRKERLIMAENCNLEAVFHCIETIVQFSLAVKVKPLRHTL